MLKLFAKVLTAPKYPYLIKNRRLIFTATVIQASYKTGLYPAVHRLFMHPDGCKELMLTKGTNMLYVPFVMLLPCGMKV